MGSHKSVRRKKILKIDYKKQKSMLRINKSQIKLLLRIISLSLCFTGFLYQTSQLFSQYLSGKTSVDNRVERLKHSELPAITVCLPTFVSMNKFADYLLKTSTNETLRQLYKDYKYLREGDLNGISADKQKYLFNLTKHIFLGLNISIIDIFEKISSKGFQMTRLESTVINESNQITNLSKPKIFESLVPFSDPRKCYTIFHGFDETYRGRKFNLVKLKIGFSHNINDFPTSLYDSDDFHIALHSANTLPEYRIGSVFLSLQMKGYYAISYAISHIRQLPPPYETNCKDYDLSQNNMRSDCMQKCIDYKLLEAFPEVKCLFTYFNYKLIQRKNLGKISNLSFCDFKKFDHFLKVEMNKVQIEYEYECKEKCPVNCEENYFDFSLGRVKHWTSDLKEEPNEVLIAVQHNRFDDRIVTYNPILSLILVMSEFGGLLGVWLGLSFAFAFDFLLRFI